MIISRPEPLVEDLVIRPAWPGEEETVLDILAEAAAWLRGRGIAQWPERFPVESVRSQIAAGEALLVHRVDQGVATLCVAERDDLWEGPAQAAYYIGRLAVSRAASGAWLGYRLIDWVSAKAVTRGWPYVRLATARDNPGLRRYYERAGFEHVADPPGARWPTSLYQRRCPPPNAGTSPAM